MQFIRRVRSAALLVVHSAAPSYTPKLARSVQLHPQPLRSHTISGSRAGVTAGGAGGWRQHGADIQHPGGAHPDPAGPLDGDRRLRVRAQGLPRARQAAGRKFPFWQAALSPAVHGNGDRRSGGTNSDPTRAPGRRWTAARVRRRSLLRKAMDYSDAASPPQDLQQHPSALQLICIHGVPMS